MKFTKCSLMAMKKSKEKAAKAKQVTCKKVRNHQ